MNGFLFIDKPKGLTSFSCLRGLRKVCNMKRLGFLGTLDPLATGLMIYAVGEATKLISFLEGMDKVYDVWIELGAKSTTYDAEGELTVKKNPRKPGRVEIEEMLEEEFLGERMQVPPAYSAIQIGGKRAYALARKGEKVELKSRKVVFYDLKLKSYSWPMLRISVHCSSGTYIRSLAHDLGEKLGCYGYVKDLRRTKIGSYSIKDAVKYDDLNEVNYRNYIISPQDMLKDWLQIDLSDSDYKVLASGGFVGEKLGVENGAGVGDLPVASPILALYRGQCVGVLERHKGKLKFKKKFN